MAGLLPARHRDRPWRIGASHPDCDAAAPGRYPSVTRPGAACRRQAHDEADALPWTRVRYRRARSHARRSGICRRAIPGRRRERGNAGTRGGRTSSADRPQDRLRWPLQRHGATAEAVPHGLSRARPNSLRSSRYHSVQAGRPLQHAARAGPAATGWLDCAVRPAFATFCSRSEEPEHSRPASLSESTPSTIRRRRVLPRQDRYGCSRGTVRSGRTTAVP